MGKRTIKVIQLHCERCGWNWLPSLEVKNVQICPHCKSARWDEPKEPGIMEAPCAKIERTA